MARKQKRDDAALEIQNAAKTLLANIRFSSVDDPMRSIVVTSSIPNEGKSFVSVNLAQAIATSGKTVLLVECDMRRRSLANYLSLHPAHGLYSVLSGQQKLSDAVTATRQRGMYFLDAEPHIPNPPDLLNSRHFEELRDSILNSFDYVIFDTPPVATFVDAAVLSARVDATILVVRENFTHRTEVQNAYDQLQKAGANIAGVVMNHCECQRSEYYYEYYYKDDGKNQGKKIKGDAADAVAMSLDIAGNAGVPLPKPVKAPFSRHARQTPAEGTAPDLKTATPTPRAAAPSQATIPRATPKPASQAPAPSAKPQATPKQIPRMAQSRAQLEASLRGRGSVVPVVRTDDEDY